MKRFLLTLLTIGGIIFLILGYIYWQDKTSVSTTNKEVSAADIEDAPSEGEKTKETAEQEGSMFYSNWPESAQEDYLAAKENGKPYKVAIVGSTALGKDTNGWSEQLKSALLEKDPDTLNVEIFQYDTITIDFIYSEQSEEVAAYAPDMVLFEPFSLNDNTKGVTVQDNHDSIEIFLRTLKEANEDVTLLLQPTYPLYNATYYPGQVEELQAFAEEKGYTYLNHWEEWPEDETLDDLNGDNEQAPSEEGHKLWADYLIKYFIAE
ncbi:SGNH/GDSL hydrolase family protein [Rossellomorea oryzaecorticis]|uniref:SGNH/GDSL hydrolase family protein n=1 Tax=Rossellomorea oryzaecorticis TaxID=1396505 RepID=A0ABW8VVT9_9BACI